MDEDLEARLARSDEEMPVVREELRRGFRLLCRMKRQAAANGRRIAEHKGLFGSADGSDAGRRELDRGENPGAILHDMDEDSRRRFEDLEAHLDKTDQRTLAIRDLVYLGMRLLRGMQQHLAANDTQIAALIDSDLRLNEKLDRLTDDVRATQQSLKAFIDSMRQGGNGNPPPSPNQ